MLSIADEIRKVVEGALGPLSELSSEQVSFKISRGKWSKKEMLGHLIDSAANNHQRFVRAVQGGAEGLEGYDQNAWVAIQGYQQAEWSHLLQLWSSYNRHLCHLLERIPPEALPSPCGIGRGETVPLEFVIRDYLRHLNHHLRSLLDQNLRGDQS